MEDSTEIVALKARLAALTEQLVRRTEKGGKNLLHDLAALGSEVSLVRRMLDQAKGIASPKPSRKSIEWRNLHQPKVIGWRDLDEIEWRNLQDIGWKDIKG